MAQNNVIIIVLVFRKLRSPTFAELCCVVSSVSSETLQNVEQLILLNKRKAINNLKAKEFRQEEQLETGFS